MTSDGLGEMFEGDFQDMGDANFPLASIGGQADPSSLHRRGPGPHRRERKFIDNNTTRDVCFVIGCDLSTSSTINVGRLTPYSKCCIVFIRPGRDNIILFSQPLKKLFWETFIKQKVSVSRFLSSMNIFR